MTFSHLVFVFTKKLKVRLENSHRPAVCRTCGKVLAVGDLVSSHRTGTHKVFRHFECWNRLFLDSRKARAKWPLCSSRAEAERLKE